MSRKAYTADDVRLVLVAMGEQLTKLGQSQPISSLISDVFMREISAMEACEDAAKLLNQAFADLDAKGGASGESN